MDLSLDFLSSFLNPILFSTTNTRLQRIIDYEPKDNAFNIKENEYIIDIVERILESNNKIQSGQWLETLTSNQMLCRLPISLAQLNAGNN